MFKVLQAAAIGLTLALAACGDGNKASELIAAITTPITNPADAREVYAMKNGYAAGLQLKKDWRAYCWSQSYSKVMKDPAAAVVCQNRRPRWRAILAAQAKASSAVVDAETFVRDHPTLNAAEAIAAGWRAVKNFQNAVPK